MSEGTVRVDLAYLSQLHHLIATAATNLAGGAKVPYCSFMLAPEVEEAWLELYKRWDERGRKLFENLAELADATATIEEAFRQADDQLAAGLGGGGGGGGAW
jgi:hypothetical protein